MLVGSILPVLKQYMSIYIITSVFITIKGVLIHTVNTNTKTSIVYNYKVLVIIRASLILQVAYLVTIVKIKPEEIFSTTNVINVSQIKSAAIALFLTNIIF
jgi:hypothetical protein